MSLGSGSLHPGHWDIRRPRHLISTAEQLDFNWAAHQTGRTVSGAGFWWRSRSRRRGWMAAQVLVLTQTALA